MKRFCVILGTLLTTTSVVSFPHTADAIDLSPFIPLLQRVVPSQGNQDSKNQDTKDDPDNQDSKNQDTKDDSDNQDSKNQDTKDDSDNQDTKDTPDNQDNQDTKDTPDK